MLWCLDWLNSTCSFNRQTVWGWVFCSTVGTGIGTGEPVANDIVIDSAPRSLRSGGDQYIMSK